MNDSTIHRLLLGLTIAVAAVDPERLGSSSWAQPLVLGVLAGLSAYLTTARWGRPSLPSASLWLTAWLFWAAIGAARSDFPGTTLFTVGCFAAIGISATALAQHDGVEGAVSVLGFGAAFSVVLAGLVSLVGEDGGLGGRLDLLFLEPNQLARAAGLVMVGVCALGLHELLGDRRPDRLAILIAASVVTAGALVLTESRTGVAATAVGLLVVVSAQLSRRLSLATIGAVGALLAVAAVVVLTGSAGDSINQSLSRSASQPTNELSTLNGRTVLWPEIVEVAREQPVTGIGLGVDRTVVSQFRAEGRVAWKPEHAHSLPLHLWLTTGFFGVIAVFGAIATAAIQWWRRPSALARTFALGALAVIVIDGIVEPTLRVPTFAWFVLAWIAGWEAPVAVGDTAAPQGESARVRTAATAR